MTDDMPPIPVPEPPSEPTPAPEPVDIQQPVEQTNIQQEPIQQEVPAPEPKMSIEEWGQQKDLQAQGQDVPRVEVPSDVPKVEQPVQVEPVAETKPYQDLPEDVQKKLEIADRYMAEKQWADVVQKRQEVYPEGHPNAGQYVDPFYGYPDIAKQYLIENALPHGINTVNTVKQEIFTGMQQAIGESGLLEYVELAKRNELFDGDPETNSDFVNKVVALANGLINVQNKVAKTAETGFVGAMNKVAEDMWYITGAETKMKEVSLSGRKQLETEFVNQSVANQIFSEETQRELWEIAKYHQSKGVDPKEAVRKAFLPVTSLRQQAVSQVRQEAAKDNSLRGLSNLQQAPSPPQQRTESFEEAMARRFGAI